MYSFPKDICKLFSLPQALAAAACVRLDHTLLKVLQYQLSHLTARWFFYVGLNVIWFLRGGVRHVPDCACRATRPFIKSKHCGCCGWWLCSDLCKGLAATNYAMLCRYSTSYELSKLLKMSTFKSRGDRWRNSNDLFDIPWKCVNMAIFAKSSISLK